MSGGGSGAGAGAGGGAGEGPGLGAATKGAGSAKRKIEGTGHKSLDAPVGQANVNLKGYLHVFKYVRRALALVWSTSKPLTIGLALCALAAGALPGGIAWVGKH